MASKKIIGWVLIVSGLLLIVLGIYSSFNIFTGRSSAPEIFKAQEMPDKAENNTIEKEAEKMVSEQIDKIIPKGAVYKILNMTSWSIFMAVLFLGGGKIATIGIGMLKS